MKTMKWLTTVDLMASDTSANMRVGWLPSEIKAKDRESPVFIPLPKKVEVKRKKETDDIQEGRDVKEQFRMVVKRLASERRVEAGNTVHWRQSRLSRTVDQRDSERLSSGKRSPKSCMKWDRSSRNERPRGTRSTKKARQKGGGPLGNSRRTTNARHQRLQEQDSSGARHQTSLKRKRDHVEDQKKVTERVAGNEEDTGGRSVGRETKRRMDSLAQQM